MSCYISVTHMCFDTIFVMSVTPKLFSEQNPIKWELQKTSQEMISLHVICFYWQVTNHCIAEHRKQQLAEQMKTANWLASSWCCDLFFLIKGAQSFYFGFWHDFSQQYLQYQKVYEVKMWSYVVPAQLYDWPDTIKIIYILIL